MLCQPVRLYLTMNHKEKVKTVMFDKHFTGNNGLLKKGHSFYLQYHKWSLVENIVSFIPHSKDKLHHMHLSVYLLSS